MASKTVRLKGAELAAQHNKTAYRIRKDSGLAYSTVHSLVKDGGHGFNGKTLYAFLVGLGYSDQQIVKLSLGDVLQIVEDDTTAA